jgi:hypothetical protein
MMNFAYGDVVTWNGDILIKLAGDPFICSFGEVMVSHHQWNAASGFGWRILEGDGSWATIARYPDMVGRYATNRPE